MFVVGKQEVHCVLERCTVFDAVGETNFFDGPDDLPEADVKEALCWKVLVMR